MAAGSSDANGEVAAVGRSAIDAASRLQVAGKDRYRPSEPWRDFSRKVEVLRRKHRFWLEEFHRSSVGGSVIMVKSLVEALRTAKRGLEKEQAKLLKKNRPGGCGFSCCTGPAMAVFPEWVGSSVQAAINAFDSVPGFQRAEEGAAAARRERILRRLFLLPIRKDDRYVPLGDLESEIFSALDDPKGPPIVLLHGRAGTGKATLAKAVALHYKEATSPGSFDQVVFLECGVGADATVKQFELLQLVARVADVADPPQELSGSDMTIPKRLAGLLRDESMLVVLDDVWDGEFLDRMMDLFGTKVRCLVTSQNRDLCQRASLSSTDIQTGAIGTDDARRILASHAAFPNSRLPRHFESVANKLIEETKANPLALASIATVIDRKRADELAQWEAVVKAFSQVLFQREFAKEALGMKYPRGFWSAMRLASEFLSRDEKKLLVLMHMCEGPSVPEEVVYVLYRSAHFQSNWESFAKLGQQLEGRELVKISPVSDNPREQRSWSIHPLKKQFVGEEMTDGGGQSAFTSVGGLWGTIAAEGQNKASNQHEIVGDIPEVEEAVMTAMGALYFSRQFAEVAVEKFGISLRDCNHLKRSAIEPVTRLVGLPTTDRWSKSLLASARQVFLSYILDGAFHEEGISNLLASPFSNLAMLSCLKDIALVERSTLLNDRTQGLLKGLLTLFADVERDHLAVRTAAGRTLFHLSCDGALQSPAIVAQSRGFLEGIVKILAADPDPNLRVLAAEILANMARSHAAALVIVEYPGAIAALDKALEDGDHPRLQLGAAWAIANITSGGAEAKSHVMDSDGILNSLVGSLSADGHSLRQVQAAIALANLAGGNEEKKAKLLSLDGAVNRLVTSLSKDKNPECQRHVARTIANLAAGDSNSKLVIFNSRGALEMLVQSLGKDENPYVQKHSARAIANLASGHAGKKLAVSDTPGAVEELVKAMGKDANPDLIVHSARAISNIGAGGADKKAKIVDTPGALEQLVRALYMDEVAVHAAGALANLAGGDNEVKAKVANFPGAVERLVQALGAEGSADLQHNAARGLCGLVDKETRQTIVEVPAAVPGLEKAAAQGDNPGLQKYALKAMAKVDGRRDSGGPRRRSSSTIRRKRSASLTN